jgi:hypothetical protein
MRLLLIAVYAAALAFSGVIMADENTIGSEPIELSTAQMDQITAGTLLLPNGNLQFEKFDNPAPNVNGYIGLCDVVTGEACHPAVTRRSDTAFRATFAGQRGPWASTAAAGGPLGFVCDAAFCM